MEAVVFKNRSKTCIVTKTGASIIFYIPLKSEGLEVLSAFRDEFKKDGWEIVKDVSAVYAAHKYLSFAKLHGATEDALRSLKSIVHNNEEVTMKKKIAAVEGTETKKIEKAITSLVAKKESVKAKKEVSSPKATKKIEKVATPLVAKKESVKSKKKAESLEVPEKVKKMTTKAEDIPKPKIGQAIKQLLLSGHSTEDIVCKILKDFPQAKTKAANVTWYKSKMRQAGEY